MLGSAGGAGAGQSVRGRKWGVRRAFEASALPDRRTRWFFVRIAAAQVLGNWSVPTHGIGVRKLRTSGIRPRAGKAEPEVVVAVAGIVVVAIRRPHVPGVIVPGAAAINPVRACMPPNLVSIKTDLRKLPVSA